MGNYGIYDHSDKNEIKNMIFLFIVKLLMMMTKVIIIFAATIGFLSMRETNQHQICLS